nr:antitoxin VapB family protein [Candidatus Sigynarchaeota archaeon]
MLEKMKLEGESFSDVILRLIASAKKDPLRHFGIGKNLPAPINDVFEEGINGARTINRRRSRKLDVEFEGELSRR